METPALHPECPALADTARDTRTMFMCQIHSLRSLKFESTDSIAPHYLHPHWLTAPSFRRRSNDHLPNLAIAHLPRYFSRCAACFVFEVSACASRKQRRHDIGMAGDGCKVICGLLSSPCIRNVALCSRI